MERVRSLPPGESLDFNITFDPITIEQAEGEAETHLHFNVSEHTFYIIMTVRFMLHACTCSW